MSSIHFSDKQTELLYSFLMDIQNSEFLATAENDSSSAYWNIENRVENLIEELYMEWHKPMYELEFREFPNNSFWSVNRVTDKRGEFTSKDEATAREKCNEMNKPFKHE